MAILTSHVSLMELVEIGVLLSWRGSLYPGSANAVHKNLYLRDTQGIMGSKAVDGRKVMKICFVMKTGTAAKAPSPCADAPEPAIGPVRGMPGTPDGEFSPGVDGTVEGGAGLAFGSDGTAGGDGGGGNTPGVGGGTEGGGEEGLGGSGEGGGGEEMGVPGEGGGIRGAGPGGLMGKGGG